MNKICVLGSINMDHSIQLDKIPYIGETVIAKDMNLFGGGKGANQAIACSRMGSHVSFVGKIGNDNNGKLLLERLKSEGINTQFTFTDDKAPTGQAIINVDKNGNNNIVVIPGANMSINNEDISKSEESIRTCDIIISQFEVPTEAIIHAFKIAKKNGVITVLNPAPVKDIPQDLIELTDIFIPNEVEMAYLSGITIKDVEDAKKAGNKFLEEGLKCVIITLGEKGCAVITKDHACILPTFECKVVDTTAAGDSFIGAFCSKLGEINYKNIKEACFFAIYVSVLVVQRPGAQESIPYFKDIEKGYIDYLNNALK